MSNTTFKPLGIEPDYMQESHPDGPANHTGSNIGALYKEMTKNTRVNF